MNKKKAINLAIVAIHKQIQHFAVDANLHDEYGADFPYAVKASEKKKQLLEAIEELEKMKNG